MSVPAKGEEMLEPLSLHSSSPLARWMDVKIASFVVSSQIIGMLKIPFSLPVGDSGFHVLTQYSHQGLL